MSLRDAALGGLPGKRAADTATLKSLIITASVSDRAEEPKRQRSRRRIPPRAVSVSFATRHRLGPLLCDGTGREPGFEAIRAADGAVIEVRAQRLTNRSTPQPEAPDQRLVS